MTKHRNLKYHRYVNVINLTADEPPSIYCIPTFLIFSVFLDHISVNSFKLSSNQTCMKIHVQ